MKAMMDPASPWGQRLWFDDHEFDSMMDEVRLKTDPGIFQDGSGIDVETILERVFNVVLDYVDLPERILGKTVFYPGGQFEVHISRRLSDEAETDIVARRRLRATLAHECAHIVEHGHIHLVDDLTLPLFGEAEPSAPKVMCRQESVGNFKNVGYDGEWWEYQANRGMASLLLPKREAGEYVRQMLLARGWTTMRDALFAQEAERLIRGLMCIFDVNMQVVVFRLQELGILPRDTAQTPLVLEDRAES